MKRLNLRTKLLLVFLGLFTLTFAGVFIWFLKFATDQAMENLREDLKDSARLAASHVDANMLMDVYIQGKEGSAYYNTIQSDLQAVRDENPRIEEIYIMTRLPGSSELVFIVDADEEASDVLRSVYETEAPKEMLLGFEQPSADQQAVEDEFGEWLSGYSPVRDADGNAFALVGVDMAATSVREVRNRIVLMSLVIFGIVYLVAGVAIFLLSGTMTRSLRQITGASKSLDEGKAWDASALSNVAAQQDEIGNLARVFSHMAVQVQAREQELRQTVSNLRIEIDDIKRQTQVQEITENADFKELQEKARALRRARSEEG